MPHATTADSPPSVEDALRTLRDSYKPILRRAQVIELGVHLGYTPWAMRRWLEGGNSVASCEVPAAILPGRRKYNRDAVLAALAPRS